MMIAMNHLFQLEMITLICKRVNLIDMSHYYYQTEHNLHCNKCQEQYSSYISISQFETNIVTGGTYVTSYSVCPLCGAVDSENDLGLRVMQPETNIVLGLDF